MISINVFLKKACYFLSIPIFSILLLLVFLAYKNNKVLDDYKIGSEITALFIGDSHVKKCINDSIIPNSINLSQNSESYYFSFFKIKRLLKSNSSIKKVYLGFSYHNLSIYIEDFVFGQYSKDITPKYFFIVPNIEKLKILKNNSNNISVFIKNIIKNETSVSSLGNYENNFKNVSANNIIMDQRLKFQFYQSNKLDGFSKLNLHYLDKIVKLCEERQIELVLLTTPLHPYYKIRIPRDYIVKYNEILKMYDLQIVNFSDVKLDDSCFIPDGDHVSEKGANIASKYITNLIKQERTTLVAACTTSFKNLIIDRF